MHHSGLYACTVVGTDHRTVLALQQCLNRVIIWKDYLCILFSGGFLEESQTVTRHWGGLMILLIRRSLLMTRHAGCLNIQMAVEWTFSSVIFLQHLFPCGSPTIIKPLVVPSTHCFISSACSNKMVLELWPKTSCSSGKKQPSMTGSINQITCNRMKTMWFLYGDLLNQGFKAKQI